MRLSFWWLLEIECLEGVERWLSLWCGEGPDTDSLDSGVRGSWVRFTVLQASDGKYSCVGECGSGDRRSCRDSRVRVDVF